MVGQLKKIKSKEWVEGFNDCYELIKSKYEKTNHYNLSVVNFDLKNQIDELDEKVIKQAKMIRDLENCIFMEKVDVRKFSVGEFSFYTNAPDRYVQDAKLNACTKTPKEHPHYDLNVANVIVTNINGKTPYKASFKQKYVI